MSFGKRSFDNQNVASPTADRGFDRVEDAINASRTGGSTTAAGSSDILGLVLGVFIAGFVGVVSVFLLPTLLFDTGVSTPTYNHSKGVRYRLMGAHGSLALKMTRPDQGKGISNVDIHINEMCDPSDRQWTGVDKRGRSPNAPLFLQSRGAKKFLPCAARINAERFCDPFYRGRFAHRIAGYVRMRLAMVEAYRRLKRKMDEAYENDPTTRRMADTASRIAALGNGPSKSLRTRGIVGGAGGAPYEVEPWLAKLVNDATTAGILTPVEMSAARFPQMLQEHALDAERTLDCVDAA